MEDQIVKELKALRQIIAQLIGTADLSEKEKFSKDAIDKASKEFQKLSIERGEWIADEDISKCIRNAGWRSGDFIREHFHFCNYFKRGRKYFYNKADLIALNKELKDRNINLSRYIELIHDQIQFKKYLTTASANKKFAEKRKSFKLPEDLKEIQTSEIPPPAVDLIRQDLASLKEEFFEYKLAEYIDIYHENYAMMKSIYYFEKYISPELKKRCRRWCENFNYANNALEMVTKKKEKFIPVKEEDMIQL